MWSLNSHQLCDGRSKHHQLLVLAEEEVQAGEVAVLLVGKLLLGQILGHDGFHLQTHVISQEGEEMVLHVTVDKRVSKDPVQQRVPGQVQDPVCHLIHSLRSACWGEHGKADVLKNVDMNIRHREHRSADEHAEQSAERRLEPRDVDQQPVLRIKAH